MQSNLVVILILGLSVSGIVCETQPFSEKLRKKIMDSSEEDSDENANSTAIISKYCPVSKETLKNASYPTIDCIENLNFNLTVCELVRVHIPQCLESLTKTFEGCLKGDGASLPKFLVDVMVSITGFVCSSTGEELMEILNTCFLEGLDETFIPETIMDEISKVKEDEFPSKSYICSVMNTQKTALISLVEKSCGNELTKKFHRGLIKAILSPCDVNENVVN